MAKGEPLSAHQQKIVRRYYEHRETISLTRLGELVSELWLCEDPKRLAAMWDRVGRALAGLGVAPERLGRLMEQRDTEALVRLIGELDRGGAAGGGAAAGGSPPRGVGSASTPAAATPRPPAPGPSGSAGPAGPAGPVDRGGRAGGATPPPDGEQLKAAMRAFKKRLKLKRLDDESGLSRSPLSSGKPSGVLAIQPPAQFPPAVWEELVRQGRLVKEGRGLYRMP